MAATQKAGLDDIGAIDAQPTPRVVTASARDMTLELLASRSQEATVCPSEVARAIAPGPNWRDAMPMVHAAVDGLVENGIVRLSWKGCALETRSGPYRIGRTNR